MYSSRFIGQVLLWLIPCALAAQCPMEVLGTLRFQEDFGSGENPGPAFPDNTDYNYGPPMQGNYSTSNTTGINGVFWHNAPDHTPGDENGYMLIFDARDVSNSFFTYSIGGLCPGGRYLARIYVANVVTPTGCGGTPGGTPRMDITVEDVLTGEESFSMQESFPTFDSLTWRALDVEFTLGPASTNVEVRLTNAAGGGCGKDFAIDDLEIYELPILEQVEHDLCQGPITTESGRLLDMPGIYQDTIIEDCGLRIICYDLFFGTELTADTQFFQACANDSLFIAGELILGDTIWTDTLLENGNCPVLQTYQVNFGPTEPISQSLTLCPGDTVFVGSNFYTSAGRYLDSLRSPNGCDSIIITDIEEVNINVDLSVDGEILDYAPGDPPAEVPTIQGNSPQINVLVNSQDTPIFQWQASNQLSCLDQSDPCLLATQNELLQLGIRFENLVCAIDLELDLKVLPCKPAYFPSAFSPNFDGINDRFAPFLQPCVSELLELSIFDRWGSLRYQSDDPRGWDGESNGRTNPTGVYLYLARLQLVDGSIIERAGDIMLLR